MDIVNQDNNVMSDEVESGGGYTSMKRSIRRKRVEDTGQDQLGLVSNGNFANFVSGNNDQGVTNISENQSTMGSPSKQLLGYSSLANRRKSLRPRVLSNRARLTNWGSGTIGVRGACPKSRSRRHVLKKNPMKLAAARAPIQLNTVVYHDGIRYQIGDIVSVTDVEGGIYYAQIRCLLSDNYDGKCCVLTWLAPTMETKTTNFDPQTYIIAMEEDIPRHIDCCDFVCRCPADYFRPLASPFDIYQHQDFNLAATDELISSGLV